LDYFGARYYDKTQYRFISVDPIMARTAALFDPQLWHLYSYCRNSPVTFFDPEGKQPIFIRVVRDYYSSSSTVGVIYADGIRFGATYELPWRNNINDISCIELGLYAAWVACSPKRGYEVIWLENKESRGYKRTRVQIHPGEKVEYLKGCIGVSQESFVALMGYITLTQASNIAANFLVDFYFPLMVFVSVEDNANTPAGAVYTDWFFGTLWDFLLLTPWYLI
jgi:RHS repeat-associated protein